MIPTNTFILSFDSPTPPTKVKAGYVKLNVRPYVPTPMRCYKCHKFGHGREKCRRQDPFAVNVGRHFQKYKTAKEKAVVDFSSDNTEPYNKPFMMSELKAALKKSNETAAGPDGIYYQFLTHLPSKCLDILLKILNDIWSCGIIPPSWKEANIIPIPKPNRDPSDPNNYTPIALTSCLCKTLERMVNDRLVWVLESQNLISKYQCGFRKDDSTFDHLIRFESGIREAFARKKQVLAVFFDLEKAYDTTWKHGILMDLHDSNFRGRLPTFI
ncbi:RNA-directed DNA polymerase from mobile element jockey [Elysia marginata]|uniref:RNA-directed DNA polymerase from mobile element jockey n=1 Tax=Elysia marginata TaxID=1093978 RepID=A0AAV4JLM7_9GAST|nr:RNA-directed DNA polymerase from mobile element jockey [Elysia marginata]